MRLLATISFGKWQPGSLVCHKKTGRRGYIDRPNVKFPSLEVDKVSIVWDGGGRRTWVDIQMLEVEEG
jgi:hypothetical protein